MLLQNHNRGFTLLEVLVAFSITALALGVLYQIYTKGTTSVILGKEYSEAILIAESKLALLETEELECLSLSGTEYDRYDWQITVSDYEYTDEDDDENIVDFDPLISLKTVELELSWNSKGKQRTLELRTLRPISGYAGNNPTN